MTDTVRVPMSRQEARLAAQSGVVAWLSGYKQEYRAPHDTLCDLIADAMLAASPQDEEGQREPLEPVVYGDERDELLALIRKRCPDFTAFPECPPEDMVKGGDTERKNDEAIERAFQDFRLAASPQGEGSSADADTYRGAEGDVVARWPVRVSWIYEHTHRGQRTQMAGTYGLTTTNTKGEGLRAVLGEIERQSEWVLERSPNTKTVITITLDADTPTAASSVGMSEANAPYRVTEGVKP